MDTDGDAGGTSVAPGDDTDTDNPTPAPVMRLLSKLDESSDGDPDLDKSSSLVIEEVEMGDCD